MNEWICCKCGHEFPNEQAILSPDRISMVVISAVGGLVLLAGLGMVGMYFLVLDDSRFIVYGILAALFSLPIIRFALQCGKGILSICPSCGMPRGFRLDSGTGKDFQKQFQNKR